MQDQTPSIVEQGTHCTSYTGDYASVILGTIRRSPRGVAVSTLMDGLGIMSRHGQTFPDFVEAMDHLLDCGIIGSEEYDALPDDGKMLDPKQVWRTK